MLEDRYRHLEISFPVSGLESCPGCHPERSEGSVHPSSQILRCAQDDRHSLHMSRPIFRAVAKFDGGVLKTGDLVARAWSPGCFVQQGGLATMRKTKRKNRRAFPPSSS